MARVPPLMLETTLLARSARLACGAMLACGLLGCSGPSQGTSTSSASTSGPPAAAPEGEAAPSTEQPWTERASTERASTERASTEQALPALPAEIRAHVHLPGPQPDDHLFVTVSLDGLPWTITGCVTASHGACEETARVELTDADREALVTALAEVRAIPRCEPEGLFPGDRAYRLDLTGGPRPYEGHLPADLAQVEARGEGPCRADARLAWWIVRRFGAR